MQFSWTLQKHLIAFTTAHFYLSSLMPAPSSRHCRLVPELLYWKNNLHTCPGCTVTSWYSHVRSTPRICSGTSTYLFWDLYFFSSISKTFLPQLMLSPLSLPTTLYRKDCSGGEDTPCCSLQSDLIALSRWADDHHVLYNGSKSAELPIGARPRAAVKQPPLRLADSDIPRVFNHTHLGVTLASNLRWDDHIDRLGGEVAGYVHLCRTLAFRHNMHGWPFVASLLHLFVHAWRTVVQCGVVHHLPC